MAANANGLLSDGIKPRGKVLLPKKYGGLLFFFSNSLKIILKPFEIVYYNRNVGANTNFLQSIFLRMIKF